MANPKKDLEKSYQKLSELHAALKKEKQRLERKVRQLTRRLEQLKQHLEKELDRYRQIQQRLEESVQTYRTLVEHSNDAIYVLQNNRFVLVNKRFTEIFGYAPEELIGKEIFDFVAAESFSLIEQRHLQRAAGESPPDIFEFTAINKQNQAIVCEASVASIIYEGKPAIQGVIRDVTERRILEKQLLQAQKMEAIGRLAGGVAHDFNNLLTVIRVYAQLLMSRLSPQDPAYADVEKIQLAEQKAARLTSQLLAFSRKQIRQPIAMNLNSLIEELEKMLRRIIGEDIELSSHLDPKLWPIKADPVQMEQVIMNLVVNARDAMPEGGKLILETRNVALDKEYIRRHAQVREGEYVLLAVSDTGTGMGEETIRKVFEPFFTTKAQGTGLGLATVYGIVKQNEGYIWVYSEPGQGTTFKIYLPRAGETVETRKREEIITNNLKGHERILLVEDDDSVREATTRILTEYGYEVRSVSSPEEALKVVKKEKFRPQLLITDVVLRGMNGRQLAEKLQKIVPEMKVIYISGYAENAIVHRGVLDDHLNFLSKPYVPIELLQTIRRVIEA